MHPSDVKRAEIAYLGDRCFVDMRIVHRILVLFLLSAACGLGQMTVISTPLQDPEVKPEQLTATIVYYQKMRLGARRSIRILALALQNLDPSGSKARLNDAINNEQDIVDWANWCITALRDKTDAAVTCAFPPGLNEIAAAQGQESACQAAANSLVHVNCSQQPASAKRTESPDKAPTAGNGHSHTQTAGRPTS
jgi:hypothetical protein